MPAGPAGADTDCIVDCMAALQCTAERGALLEGVTCGRLSSQDGERVCWMDDLCQEAPSDEGGRCSEGPEAGPSPVQALWSEPG